MSLTVFWTVHHYYATHEILNNPPQPPGMLSDFVVAHSSDEFTAINNTNSSNIITGNNGTAGTKRLSDLTQLTSSQQTKQAKFMPQAENQQIDQLMRVSLLKQGHRSMPSLVNFKISPYTRISQNLNQCGAILSTRNSLHEIIYWENHPDDFNQLSQLFNPDQRYLTFEPPVDSFQSQRQVLEHMVVLAFALGRTLVLPPRQGMRDGTLLSYSDFFDLHGMVQTFKGLKIVSTDEFLQYVAMPGYLRAPNGMPHLPPYHRLNWDSAPDMGLLYEYLRTVGTMPMEWDPQKCIIGFRGDQMQKHMKRIIKKVDGRKMPTPLDFQGKPTPVAAPDIERLREFLAERTTICPGELHVNSVVLHFPTTTERKSLVQAPFYSFFFFDNWQQDLLVKRMIRDHLRYNDIIVCAAARIIDWLRVNVGHYDAMHIRGPAYEDSHSDVNTNPEWIVHDMQKYIPKGSSVYIATDHSDKSWFQPLRKDYQLYFASDFAGVFDSLLPWYKEMVEQLICARGRNFVGTYYSSFSAYINRLRGYLSERDNPDADGEVATSYYASPVNMQKDMKTYRALRRPFTMREWPTAWRDINHGVPPPPKTAEPPKQTQNTLRLKGI
jgi:hypothetical protein